MPAALRDTLLARLIAGRACIMAWDVVMQGKDETVFFDR